MANFMALYYPFMEFQDDAWVKLAALYWNKLGRIVPRDSLPPLDSPTVKQFIDELGFIKNLYPTVEDTAVVSRMFLEVLNKHEEVLVKHYGLTLKPINIPPLDIEAARRQTVFVRTAKMHKSLKKEFIRRELLRPLSDEEVAGYTASYEKYVAGLRRGDSRRQGKSKKVSYFGRVLSIQTTDALEDRVVMHPKLAFTYMQVLAEQMASNRRLSPVTDDIFSHLAISGYTVERLTQVLLSEGSQPPLTKDNEMEVQMATIALRSVLPRNLSDIPASQIIKLRSQYNDEMSAFQEYVHALAVDLEQLRGIQDLEALQAHLEIVYERKFKSQLNELRKCLNSLGISTVDGVMNIQVALPALLASAVTSAGAYFHLAPVNPIVIGAGTLAFSIFPVIRKKQEEAKQLIRSSPTAYLLHVQEHLEPVQVTSKMTRLARYMLFRV